MTRYIGDFIHDFQIVALAVEYGDKSDFYCLDISRGIKVGHAPIKEKALENLFKRFLRKVVGEAANSYKFSDLFVKLKDLIPLLGSDNCDLAILNKELQIFLNGMYDVRENVFYKFKGNERIFGQFPINVKFSVINQDVFPATDFDKILDDVFDGDMNKICLLYQILGAIMSNINLKHIFVFQGRHHCGKTTLTEILSAIIGSDKCQSMFDWSDLKDYTQEELNAYKLVVVKDASDRPITPKQLSLLKNFADGTQSHDSSNFKLIINTNNTVLILSNFSPRLKIFSTKSKSVQLALLFGLLELHRYICRQMNAHLLLSARHNPLVLQIHRAVSVERFRRCHSRRLVRYIFLQFQISTSRRLWNTFRLPSLPLFSRNRVRHRPSHFRLSTFLPLLLAHRLYNHRVGTLYTVSSSKSPAADSTLH